MKLTPEEIAQGWRPHTGAEWPVADAKTVFDALIRDGGKMTAISGEENGWLNPLCVIGYRIIEAHGADAEPARPTPFPQSYADLVFSDSGWSQTIIVDGKRPEWLERGDKFKCTDHSAIRAGFEFSPAWFAIRVRRREPKRETVIAELWVQGDAYLTTIDLIDGKPDLSTLKIAEDAL